jgi:hypothetical protein
MKQGTAGRFARLRGLGLTTRSALLGLTVAALLVVVLPLAWLVTGPAGLLAAPVAAGICLLGAVLALIVSHLLREPRVALYGMLFAMLFRMGIPLTFAVTVHLRGGALAEAGVLYYLLVFYPVTLAVETALSLPGPQASTASPAKDRRQLPQDPVR